MKKILNKLGKERILLILFLMLFGIIFFSYNITTTWDSSEYLGMADFIRNGKIVENWIGHRGFMFPFIIFLAQPFGIKNKIFILALMYIFWIGMFLSILAFYKKSKKIELLNSKFQSIAFFILIFFFIIVNPIIFGYYHTLLTEFVAMTIAVLMCYLSQNWLDYSWKENKKQIVLYAIIFSVLTAFLYHIKQSLVPITLVPILIAVVLSIINKFKLSNILTRVITLMFVLLMLVSSIKIWNVTMKGANVAENVTEQRLKGKLIVGISELKCLGNESTINAEKLENMNIEDEEKDTIKDILLEESEYKGFQIYRNSKDKYYVFFTKDNYFFKEQIGFYLKVLVNSPMDIFNSYKNGFHNIIFIEKNYPIRVRAENSVIPKRIYLNKINTVDVNEKFEQYIQDYQSVNEKNIVTKLISRILTENVYRNYIAFSKISLCITPIMFIICFIVYLIFNKKADTNTLKQLQMIIILYGVSFGLIMAYVIFGAIIDRYTVPIMPTVHIANILFIFFVYNIIRNKFVEERECKMNNSKFDWKLEDIFKNIDEFNKEKNEIKSLSDEIKKYQGKLCDSSDNLYNCYKLYEQALEKFEKVYAYGMLKYHLDMSNQESIKLFKDVEMLGTEFNVATSFITPEITYAADGKIEKYLQNDNRLDRYARDIKDILEKKKHVLSKEEENLLANYSEVFSAPENTFDILTNAEFKFGKLINENGEEVELTDSTYSLYLKSQNQSVRKQAFDLMYKKYSEFINTITEMYLANVKSKSVTAKLRKYNSSLEQAVINDDASIKVYDSLIEAVNKNISTNHEFLKLKKKMLKLPEMHMYDLYVNPFEQDKDEISFEDAKQEVLSALEVLGEEYTNKLKEAFDNNWIDVYAKDNKKGGAYSMGVYGVHPFVLTNFVNSKRDVSTIAHELGHSIHSYYSNKYQNVLDANYTIMVAEVASTVNEILLSDYQIKNEQDKVKKAELLYELLEMIRATFFRQAMFAEFEKIIHEKVENDITLSSEDLNNIYYDLNKKYFGTDIVIDEQIKYEWARIPHFYNNFYVYKYSTGVSAAIVIATRILNGEEGFVEKYIEMLKQGCSKKSIDLLKMLDIDLESKEIYESTIEFYNQKIKELENII